MKCPECNEEIIMVEVSQRFLSTANIEDENVIRKESKPEWIEDEYIQCPLCGIEIQSEIDNRLEHPASKPDLPELSNEDWVEIYYALGSKHMAVSTGYYTSVKNEKRQWADHLKAIIEIIGPDGQNMYRKGG